MGVAPRGRVIVGVIMMRVAVIIMGAMRMTVIMAVVVRMVMIVRVIVMLVHRLRGRHRRSDRGGRAAEVARSRDQGPPLHP